MISTKSSRAKKSQLAPSEEVAGFYIYAIELRHAGETWVKIGHTKNLITRIAGLQTGCPVLYSRCVYWRVEHKGIAYGYIDTYTQLVEQYAHACISDDRKQGEWFNAELSENLLQKVHAAMLVAATTLKPWVEYEFGNRNCQKKNKYHSDAKEIIAAVRSANEPYLPKEYAVPVYRRRGGNMSLTDISKAYK